MFVDRCVCCGSYVPEGRQVCAACSGDFDRKDTYAEDVAMIRWLSSASQAEISNAAQKVKKRLLFYLSDTDLSQFPAKL